jgi:heme A synthase
LLIGMKRLAVITLGWNLVTILLGALVRATHSGAGCGRSWPTCDGELVPDLSGATAIEYTHRAASGLALAAVIALAVVVWRGRARGDPARKSSAWAVIAIVAEALVGAAIVFYEWVGRDDSLARAVAVPLHLVNTLLLIGALTLTIWFLGGGSRLVGAGPVRWWLRVGAGALVLIAASGAVTALADTLFPKSGQAPLETVHFLTRMRVVHPVLAVLVVGAGALAVRRLAWPPSGAIRNLVVLTAIQMGLGVANIRFGTPLPLQLLHLLVADLIWISFVWLAAQLLSSSSSNSEGEAVGARQTMPLQT